MSKEWKEMERIVAKKLGKWWGCQFRRTPSSGAWSKNSRKGSAADDFHGDIVPPPTARFPFSVECKAYEEVELYKALYGKSNVFDWWLQCKGDALRSKRLAMLVMRENRKQKYLVVISQTTYDVLSNYIPYDTTRMELRFVTEVSKRLQRLYIFDLDQLIAGLDKDTVMELLAPE